MQPRKLKVIDGRGPTAASHLPDEVDIVVVGSGAAGLTAACVSAHGGLSVMVVEQAATIGGTTAVSGGMVWIPGNEKLGDNARADSDAAREYLAETVPHADPAEVETYLRAGPEAVAWMEAHTELQLRAVPAYPDYYPDLPGATLKGRVLEPVPYDGRQLGAAFTVLRDPLPEYTLFGGMMISREDIPHLRRAGRSIVSFVHTLRLLVRYGWQRLRYHRGTSLFLGNALAARLLQSADALGVGFIIGSPVNSVMIEGNRACGVRIGISGTTRELRARRGVVLACGGVSHDAGLRRLYVPAAAGDTTATMGNAAVASGARLGQAVGGRLSEPTQDGAFWVPVSRFTRPDGTHGVFPHTVSDRSKPGLIAVDGRGRRFTNEAVSYHEFVRAQLRNSATAIPAYLVVDKAFLWKYGLGCVKPFSPSLSRHLNSGYLRTGATAGELAKAIGVPGGALAATIDRYNGPAARGEDPEFGRGSDAYQRHLGDADRQPNACVAPLHGRLYAVAVEPADLGMAMGLVTDLDGRVLREDGTVLEGLYACGNDRQSIMRGAYPGPGITLGPAITFAYLAARRACHDRLSPQAHHAPHTRTST